jgi:ribonuclease P protein component
MMKHFTFRKAERLSHRHQIDALFNEGSNFNMGPIKVIYRISDNAASFGVKILVAVAKKKFKKAVERNSIKRLIREAYRLNKHILFDPLHTSPICLHIGFIYVDNLASIPYSEMDKHMISCLKRLVKTICSSGS